MTEGERDQLERIEAKVDDGLARLAALETGQAVHAMAHAERDKSDERDESKLRWIVGLAIGFGGSVAALALAILGGGRP